MGKILNFPYREATMMGVERYLESRECLVLGAMDPFADWSRALDEWFELHPQACSARHSSIRSSLADTWLIFHMACDKVSRFEMQPQHSLRWMQLQYHQLSDFELLVIVSDNLSDLRRSITDLYQQYPPATRKDLNLFSLIQGIDRLNQQLDRLFTRDALSSRQPEL
ncbi:hypothetical protein [Salinicola peritrichatus]|uniref:hypothetical protein n=1 Tax=Salinicola peritrichatus TaxID=1267424 RepID=UPI000DA1800A|nr:hypothetical protein [Salinicola peritrichatus]